MTLALILFEFAETMGTSLFGWEPPADLMSQALHMRVFVIELTITLTLRFIPKGLFSERVKEVH